MMRRHSYDVAFKLNIVGCAAKKSKEATAREFGVGTKVFVCVAVVLNYRDRE